ncbi:NAD-dependent epimerase [Oceanobacillus senegalensis]|uniref:NAD-dependent epimerase n=1 Tax=Oceanobacillus senegalensis TaxID=1936063 RepID=UPI000A305296|nr:NAD-dependent epimerase [Oceanobacillus senegalensis]
MKEQNILVTGAAGFIGYHLTERLLKLGYPITGIDNLNDYYDVKLKYERLNQLNKHSKFNFFQLDIANYNKILDVFNETPFPIVINLAAQAGVRYSIENPMAYIDSNLVGFQNILEACRHHNTKHLIYASSSSVYGANIKLPFSTDDSVDHPVSLYAATKKANELMAHTYSHLYGIPTTGLRFFTVYGPWGRPDMAYYSFTRDIIEGKEIKVFNHGNMKRDFTYIDDIVEGIIRLINRPPKENPNYDWSNPTPSASNKSFKVYNIGNNKPVHLMDFIRTLEKLIGRKANLKYLPMQPGDVKTTYADIDELKKDIGFTPTTSIEVGLKHFVEWYKMFYNKI